MNDKPIKKQYLVLELHNNYDLMRPFSRLEGTRPKTQPFNTKEDAEAWILQHAIEEVDYTILEVFRAVS